MLSRAIRGRISELRRDLLLWRLEMAPGTIIVRYEGRDFQSVKLFGVEQSFAFFSVLENREDASLGYARLSHSRVWDANVAMSARKASRYLDVGCLQEHVHENNHDRPLPDQGGC